MSKGTYWLHSKPISEALQYDLITNTELQVVFPRWPPIDFKTGSSQATSFSIQSYISDQWLRCIYIAKFLFNYPEDAHNFPITYNNNSKDIYNFPITYNDLHITLPRIVYLIYIWIVNQVQKKPLDFQGSEKNFWISRSLL